MIAIGYSDIIRGLTEKAEKARDELEVHICQQDDGLYSVSIDWGEGEGDLTLDQLNEWLEGAWDSHEENKRQEAGYRQYLQECADGQHWADGHDWT